MKAVHKRVDSTGSWWLSSPWFWVVSGIVIIVLVFISMDPTLSIYDEALVLYGALKVCRGELPYRDFWSFYGPGQYYVLAALFRVFGVYAFLGRLWFAVTMLITLLGVIRLQALVRGHRLLGVCAAGVSLIWIITSETYLYPIFPAIAFVVLAAICCVRHWQSGFRIWLVMSGILCGIVMLFRHDLAAYCFVALLAGECSYHLRVKSEPVLQKVWAIMGHCGWLIAGIAAVAAPAIVGLLEHVSWSDIRYQMFYIPAHIYPEMRRMPFYRFDESAGLMSRIRYAITQSIILTPILASIAAVTCLLQKKWRERQAQWQVSAYVMLLSLVLMIPISGIVRPDITHIIGIPIFVSLLLACLIGASALSSRTGRSLIGVATVCLLLTTIVPTWRAARRVRETAPILLFPHRPGAISDMCDPAPGLERITCLRISPVEQEEVRYIQQHTGPHDEVYSGVGRHDKIGMNDILFYFVSKRDAPTKWYYLEPGIETTRPIQGQMIHDLDAHRVDYVIRNLTWDNAAEPNESRFSSGVTILDQYIDSNYRTVVTFPKVLILRRTTPF